MGRGGGKETKWWYVRLMITEAVGYFYYVIFLGVPVE